MALFQISSFLESLSVPHRHFNRLKEIRPLKDEDGNILFFSGGSSVLFKVEWNGKVYGLKCYNQLNREKIEALLKIQEYLCEQNFQYVLRQELFVDEMVIFDLAGVPTLSTVALYEWIDGETLESAAVDALYFGEKERLKQILLTFTELSLKLLSAPFAHGDIKPSNIVVSRDKATLIDLDGIYYPSSSRFSADELGTRGFRHPKRDANFYNKRLDDYPILVTFVSLLIASRSSALFHKFNDGEFTLFDAEGEKESLDRLLDECRELFDDDIIEIEILRLLKSDSPSLYSLAFLLEMWLERCKCAANDKVGAKLYCDEKYYRLGVCNSLGETIFPPYFKDAFEPCNGVMAVRVDIKWGVISLDGKILIPFDFDNPPIEEMKTIASATLKI